MAAQRTMIAKGKKSSPVKTLRLILKSTLKELPRVEKFLHDVNKRLRLDDGRMYRLLVASTEAVNNAILHGNKSDTDRKVLVSCTFTMRFVKIRVKDEGSGFDPNVLDNPIEEKNLMKDHGRGVFLIRAMMDDVKFNKTRSGSVVVMTMNLNR